MEEDTWSYSYQKITTPCKHIRNNSGDCKTECSEIGKCQCLHCLCNLKSASFCLCIILQILITGSHDTFPTGFLPHSVCRMDSANLMSSSSIFCFLLVLCISPGFACCRALNFSLKKEFLIS